MDFNETAPRSMPIPETYGEAEDFSSAPALDRYPSVEAMVKAAHPEFSTHCMHPDRLHAAARQFVEHFPGYSLYAVKSNPDPYVLRHLHAAGIAHFDVASLGEIKLIRGLFPHAHLAFMHPVKSREAIRAAYFQYGVRDFVVDTQEEIAKIVEETGNPDDLLIVVRIAMPKGSAAYALTNKFGCAPEAGIGLLQSAAKVAARVGLSFHVGSQSTDPSSYADAIRKGGEVVRQSGVVLSVFDIGGGFPIPGLGMDIPPLDAFFDLIREEIAKLGLPRECAVWSEPGRALSGNGSTLVVRVELRKGDVLYLNDGTFGNMFEIMSGNWKNDAVLIRSPKKGRKTGSRNAAPFRFYGPTCDSIDYMAGPFMLPDDVGEGDYIALEGMGAYMAASQSRFNGFYSDAQVEIATEAASADRRRKPRGRRAAHLKIVK